MAEMMKPKKRLTSFQIIILGFAGVILLGTLILMLPISSKERCFTPFIEALFTATSATCVTGLVVQDTATYWSVFGQSVIILLIQIGGLGVITVSASFALISGRKISLMQRSTMVEAMSANQVGGIVKLTGFVLKGTFLFEAIGAVAFMPVFIRDFGLRGIWMAVFHSISAFCNAGFDIMGTPDNKFASLTAYAGNIPVNITAILLIVIGGIGFLTWDDVITHRHRFRLYRMQSKVIFATTGILILIPTLFFFFVDFRGIPIKERILVSLFQAVTPRTAGFNTADFNLMTGAGRSIIIVLMLIGGAPGSTAGGMKITTVAVLAANAAASFRRKEDPEFFGRRIEAKTVKHAATILLMYVAFFFTAAVIISTADGLGMAESVFEAASAMGTAGLTVGITTSLGTLSRCVIMVLMFLGRVGGLTLIYAALSGTQKNLSKFPMERITVG